MSMQVHVVYVDADTFVVYPGLHAEGDAQVGVEHAGFEQAIAAVTKTAARTATSPANGRFFGAYEFAVKVPGMHWHPVGQVPLYAKSGRGFLVNSEDFFIVHEAPTTPALASAPMQASMSITDAILRIEALEIELAHLRKHVSMFAAQYMK